MPKGRGFTPLSVNGLRYKQIITNADRGYSNQKDNRRYEADQPFLHRTTPSPVRLSHFDTVRLTLR